MTPRLLWSALGGLCLMTACDPVAPYDPSKAARPSPTSSSDPKVQRPAVTVSPLSGACDPNAFACADSATLEYCGRTGLIEASCASICGDAGFSVSLGCGYDADLRGDACFCDDVSSSPAPSCTPGWSCSGSSSLSYCVGGTLETWSCDSVCRDAGYDYASACDWDSNGEASCFCDYAQTPAACAAGDQACGDGTCVSARYICDGYDDCASGADEYGCAMCSFEGGVCNGNNHVDVCDAAGITTHSCDTICQQSGYDFSEGCHYDPASGSDSCFCNDFASCGPNELTCGDGSCLPNQYVCDGYADCPGSSDELGCVTECIPGETYCTGAFTLESCDDHGYWVTWDCDTVCQQSGYPYADSCGFDSFSGSDACFCDY